MADIKGACLCKKFSFTLPRPDKPQPLYICHCTSCRHVMGSMANQAAHWPKTNPLPDVTQLSKYVFSPNVDIYFCDTCGTYCLWHDKRETDWYLAVGLLDEPDFFAEPSKHIHVRDTVDGGLAKWMQTTDTGKKIPCYNTDNPDDGLFEMPVTNPGNEKAPLQPSERLNAYCHCKAVSFRVAPPPANHKDIILETDDSFELAEFLSPQRPGTRYFARDCACRSCRLQASTELVTWVYVTVNSLENQDGTPFKIPSGTMKKYEVLPGNERWFCGRCSAAILLQGGDDIKLIDIAMGLFDAPEGSRAERWIDWVPDIGWPESGHNRAFARTVTAGRKNQA